MQQFTYVRSENQTQALTARRAAGATFIAGGTSLVDLMRLGVEQPQSLVDIGRLPYANVVETTEGLSIGALVRNSALAEHPIVASRLVVLSEALLSGASSQLRNMATVGGNILQRTRCPYFRNSFPNCNKLTPGTGCAAQEGYHRVHAVLGGSEHCIAVHPSDMCVALVALDAVVHTVGEKGARAIPIDQFYLLPEDHPQRENALLEGELITHVIIPSVAFFAHSHYVKIRDRASYDFALASAAAALDVRNGTIHAARLALGGVAPKPWRCTGAERFLVGKSASREVYVEAARTELTNAKPRPHNAFKVELAERAMTRALEQVGGSA